MVINLLYILLILIKKFQILNKNSIFLLPQVLPKYQIDVKTEEFLYKSSKSIEGSISAKYTYGKIVEGQVVVTIQTKAYYYYHHFMPGPKPNNTYTKTGIFTVFNGLYIHLLHSFFLIAF